MKNLSLEEIREILFYEFNCELGRQINNLSNGLYFFGKEEYQEEARRSFQYTEEARKGILRVYNVLECLDKNLNVSLEQEYNIYLFLANFFKIDLTEHSSVLKVLKETEPSYKDYFRKETDENKFVMVFSQIYNKLVKFKKTKATLKILKDNKFYVLRG